MKLLVTVCAVATLSCAASALDVTAKKTQDATNPSARQEQTKPESAADKKADSNADKPKPSPEMKKLARFIGGRWQVEEKYEVTPFTPQGGEGKGTAMVHRGPGGLSLITNYSSNGTMGETHGAGITTWSPDDKAYKQFWVDSGAPGGELWTGKWESDNLVFSNTQKMGDKTAFWHETYSGFSSDAFTITFDMGPSETDVKRFMTLKFTRMAKQSAGIRRHGTGMHGRPTYDTWSGPRADASRPVSDQTGPR